MIARLRARHRRAWILAAIALGVILVLAFVFRPAEILDPQGLEALGASTADGSEGAR